MSFIPSNRYGMLWLIFWESKQFHWEGPDFQGRAVSCREGILHVQAPRSVVVLRGFANPSSPQNGDT